MKTFATIPELHAAVVAGELDASKMFVGLDNDETLVTHGRVSWDDMDAPVVFRGNGNFDVGLLWQTLFPAAQVENV